MGSSQKRWNTNNAGTIITADGNGNNFHQVYLMDSITGSVPVGTLCFANNGKFYGVTTSGSCSNGGVCFSYNPASGIYSIINDFACDTIHGYGAMSGMIMASDGKLYGLCPNGGINGKGVIYRIDPTTDTYSDIFDFTSISGTNPNGTLIQLSNGKLYGMTSKGSTDGLGVIFSFDLTNSIYSILHSFSILSGGYPTYGGLILASNGKLYGMASGAGPCNYGVIFSFDTATNIYTDIFDFCDGNGGYPDGSLIQATNGKLYVVTPYGGTYEYGLIFSYDIDSNLFSVEHTFFMDGDSPTRSLIQASNGKLYGTTYAGGTYGKGVAYSYDITTNIYSVLINMDGSISINCDGGLIETPWLTGIPTINNDNNISIYPNPATSTFTIRGQSGIRNCDLRIMDVLGNMVYKQALPNTTEATIDISSLSQGIYFYEVRSDKESYRGKIVKE